MNKKHEQKSKRFKQACCASHTLAALARRPLTAPNAAPADTVRIDHRNGSSSNVHRQAKACLGKRLSCPELFLQLMLWIPARAGEKAARARERETVSEAGGETDGGW
jgi:hypothetical protein